MKLKGKAKEDFEKWYYRNYCKSTIKYNNLLPHQIEEVFGFFYNLKFSFKYGVFLEFLNLHGYFPETIDCSLENLELDREERFHSVLKTHEKYYAIDFHKTRLFAQIESILTSFELYNEKFTTNTNQN